MELNPRTITHPGRVHPLRRGLIALIVAVAVLVPSAAVNLAFASRGEAYSIDWNRCYIPRGDSNSWYCFYNYDWWEESWVGGSHRDGYYWAGVVNWFV